MPLRLFVQLVGNAEVRRKAAFYGLPFVLTLTCVVLLTVGPERHPPAVRHAEPVRPQSPALPLAHVGDDGRLCLAICPQAANRSTTPIVVFVWRRRIQQAFQRHRLFIWPKGEVGQADVKRCARQLTTKANSTCTGKGLLQLWTQSCELSQFCSQFQKTIKKIGKTKSRVKL